LLASLVAWASFFFPGRLFSTSSLAGSLRSWNLGRVDFAIFCWLLLVWMLLTPLLVAQIAPLSEGRNLPFHEESLKGLLAGALLQLGMFLIAMAFVRAHRMHSPLILSSSAISWFRALAVAFLAFLLLWPLVVGVSLAWKEVLEIADHHLGWNLADQTQPMVETFRNSSTIEERLALTLLVVVLAPLAEEVVFRGALYRFLKGKVTRPVVLSAVIFALVHFHPAGLPGLIVLGVVLCLVYEKTGSIRAPICLHALFNAHTLVMLLFLE
jgi:uncharacterized protein